MQLLKLLIQIFAMLICFQVKAIDDLHVVLLDFESLMKSLDLLQKKDNQYCKIMNPHQDGVDCNISNLCQSMKLNKNSEFIYKNSNGEMIYNKKYFDVKNGISSCLKEKFKMELEIYSEEKISTGKKQEIDLIKKENNNFLRLVKKYKEGPQINLLQNEILNQVLNSEVENLEHVWEQKNITREELGELITGLEKKLKIKLNQEVRKSLIELRYLLKNQTAVKTVEEEVERMFVNESNNPYLNYKLLAHKEYKIDYQEKLKKVSGLFNETKSQIELFLLKKKTEKNSEMIKRAIERIHSIKFKPFTMTKSEVEECQMPNAYYDPEKHSFTLCPQYLLFPEIALRETIAHELAHSIDPCNFSKEQLKATGPIIEEMGEIEIDSEPSTKDNYSLDSTFEFKNAIPLSDHPLYSSILCLKSKDSISAIGVDFEKLKNINKDIMSKFKGEELTSVDYKYAKNFNEMLPSFEKYYGGCDLTPDEGKGVLTLSKMQEAFSDKIASEILAVNLRNNSRDQSLRQMTEDILSFGDTCVAEGEAEELMRTFVKKYKCENYFESKTRSQKFFTQISVLEAKYFDSHPEVRDRIEKILLSHPEIRKKLNCKDRAKGKYCE